MECTEDAVEECSEFHAEVPAAKQFNSTAFDHYCRSVNCTDPCNYQSVQRKSQHIVQHRM